MQKTGLLIVNLGTPDSTKVSDVRRYLKQFLSDPRVIDINPVLRYLLLRLIILPLRPKKSAEAYREIWSAERGSPLRYYSDDLVAAVQKELGDQVHVELAMRYQNPSIEHAMQNFAAQHVERVVVFPMFPQYSSAAWGSAVEEVFRVVGKSWNVMSVSVVPPFYNDAGFIEAFAKLGEPFYEDFKPDYTLMSFHGVPERHCTQSVPAAHGCCQRSDCCQTLELKNQFCYRAQCFETARQLATKLQLEPQHWEVTFQSRLGRTPWIKPYTDERLIELAKSGVKRLLVYSPSFVADCLETLEEIGMRAEEDFIAAGGEALKLVPSLNATPLWVDAVAQLSQKHL